MRRAVASRTVRVCSNVLRVCKSVVWRDGKVVHCRASVRHFKGSESWHGIRRPWPRTVCSAVRFSAHCSLSLEARPGAIAHSPSWTWRAAPVRCFSPLEAARYGPLRIALRLGTLGPARRSATTRTVCLNRWSRRPSRVVGPAAPTCGACWMASSTSCAPAAKGAISRPRRCSRRKGDHEAGMRHHSVGLAATGVCPRIARNCRKSPRPGSPEPKATAPSLTCRTGCR